MANERFTRWQGNTLGQFSASLSVLSGLAFAALGFLFSFARTEEFRPAGWDAFLYVLAVTAFFSASIVGVAIHVTRLLDFRLTAAKARADQLKEPLTFFGSDASAYGRATWRLFWVLIVSFVLGIGCASVVLARLYLARIISAV